MTTNAHTLPLGLLKPGDRGEIAGLSGGRAFVARCLALGCTPGTTVRMERNSGRGPVVVVLRGIRLALGRGESMQVQVSRRRAGK